MTEQERQRILTLLAVEYDEDGDDSFEIIEDGRDGDLEDWEEDQAEEAASKADSMVDEWKEGIRDDDGNIILD